MTTRQKTLLFLIGSVVIFVVLAIVGGLIASFVALDWQYLWFTDWNAKGRFFFLLFYGVGLGIFFGELRYA